METLGDKFCEKSAPSFYCNICDYGTSRKSSYGDHILSTKHKKATNYYEEQIKLNNNKKVSALSNDNFVCCCGKKYKHRQGLWRHKKICDKIKEKKDEPLEIMNDKELIQYLMKEISELKELIQTNK